MNFFYTRNFYLFNLAIFVLFMVQSCISKNDTPQNDVTPEDDAAIGKAIDNALLAYLDTCSDKKYLEPTDHTTVYNYINQLCRQIDGSDNFTLLNNATDAAINSPTLRILEHTGNTGAFVVPGGYIYLYKDFLKKLDYEAQLVPILTHLMTCSKKRYDIQKLQSQFSTNFLLDLALGATINTSSSSTDIHAIIATLEDDPYSTDIVEILDREAENIACELGYDVQAYSNLFMKNNIQNIKWCQQFPRALSLSDYASHLFNNVRDSLSCNGEIDEGGFPQIKNLLN
ncbi:M48 family metalloprotease [Aureispira anguillae]|uniref:Lipoprotein n=1 Tax=Aureispira anguillae TaxID=2864201 RepID=A0A915YGI8_9BACT|nr:hypothetical protein [Aureispira anguillae]BDS12604.1 hypothetical protein AsAng_0033280 [Aureispira anguillae]